MATTNLKTASMLSTISFAIASATPAANCCWCCDQNPPQDMCLFAKPTWCNVLPSKQVGNVHDCMGIFFASHALLWGESTGVTKGNTADHWRFYLSVLTSWWTKSRCQPWCSYSTTVMYLIYLSKNIAKGTLINCWMSMAPLAMHIKAETSNEVYVYCMLLQTTAAFRFNSETLKSCARYDRVVWAIPNKKALLTSPNTVISVI